MTPNKILLFAISLYYISFGPGTSDDINESEFGIFLADFTKALYEK